MSNTCKICGIDSLFFIWSTSRVLNKRRLIEVVSGSKKNINKSVMNSIMNEEYVVCQFCCNKFGLINK